MLKILGSFYLFLIFTSINAISQPSYNFFISNSGSDLNAGTNKMFPKQTFFGATAPMQSFALQNGRVIVGLATGSVFNEALIPTYPIMLGSYNDTDNKKSFAILNGSDVFDSGWELQRASNNTYMQKIFFKGFIGSGINNIGNYSYLTVFEIDKELEKTAPITARRLLKFVHSLAEVESTPGSFYEPIGTNNPVPVTIHTSDGSSPNNNTKFRYEVTVRDRGVEAYKNNENNFNNLWVRGFGAGYGLLPSGMNSHYNKIIFGPGAGIHHVVTKNATFNNCLFLPGARNTSDNALVFYNTEGFGKRNKVSNSIFLDIPAPIYAHTSYGTNYGAVELDHVFAFGDSTPNGPLLAINNTDTVLMNNVYSENLSRGYHYGSATFADIKNSYFKDVTSGISFQTRPTNASVHNVFIKSSGEQNVVGIEMRENTNLSLTNTIIQLTNSNTSNSTARLGAFVTGSGAKGSLINATGNIFISDVKSWKALMTANTNTDLGIGTSKDIWRNNVYVLLSGSIMVWSANNYAVDNGAPTTLFSFDEWKRHSGQDSNSLFFDLRKDPRGLKAIFLDPDNGNYTLANTIEGNKIRALGAGMTTPLQCFLKKPTYEEAADMVKNDKKLSVDDCRNPCQQTNVKVLSDFGADARGNISVCKDQELTFKGTGNFTENDSYYHQSNARARYLWWFSDGKDTSGTNLNTVSHTFRDAQASEVRLQMVDENGCSFDTTFKVQVVLPPVKTGLVKDTSLCTGQTLELKANTNGANDRYKWSTGDTTTTVSVTAAGKYWVQVQNAGCKVADTIRVVNKTPISVTLGRDTTYCVSESLLLTAKKSGNIKSYQWNTGVTTDTLRINKAGTYVLTAKDFGVCSVSDTITIKDNPVNLFSLPADTTICEGTFYTLKLVDNPGSSLIWNNGTQGYTRTIRGGAYTVAAINSGCIKRDSMYVAIKPAPVVALPRDTIICSGYGLRLAVSYPAASYLWSTGSRENTVTISAKGMYWVEARLDGCTYRDSVNVTVQNCECNIRMSNAFSPNGDGINDVIKPDMVCYPADYNFSVFNRYGQVVFTTKSFTTAWAGDINGKPAPIGTYYYVITYRTDGYPNNKPLTGSITLLR